MSTYKDLGGQAHGYCANCNKSLSEHRNGDLECSTHETKSTRRHVAIPCHHTTTAIRRRLEAQLAEVQVMRDVARMLHPEEVHRVVSAIVAECVLIMWEHSDETAAQYRQLISEIKEAL